MIPIKLKLRNFMAYQDAELNFQGLHLAALTGENGAGKSSLLDAITWVVWGKGRAKRDDELIRLGQTEMEVEYTFDLNNNIYRIIRKRDASKRGRSDLSFQVQDAGGWRTLSESNLRATEKKINEIMRLDYDTFINSAFLLQGRADEFTMKAPAQRKKILGDILGLAIYDLYADRAKQRANEKDREAAIIEAEISQIERELAREPEYRTNLLEAEKEVASLYKELQIAEQAHLSLRDQHRTINDKQRQLDDLRDRLSGAQADMADLDEAIATAQKAIETFKTVLNRRAEIEAGLDQLSQARRALKDWDQRLRESTELAHQKYELDSARREAEAKIKADLREVETRINMLGPKVANVATQRSQLTQAQTELKALTALEDEQEKQRAMQQTLAEESARLTEQNRQFKQEMEDIKDSLTQLEQASFNCPICRRPLDETHRQEVLAQYQAEGKAKGDQFRANRTRLQEIVDQQAQLKDSLANNEKMLRETAKLQRKVAQLEQLLQEAEQAAVDLAASQAQEAELRRRLERQDFALDLLNNLKNVEAELAKLGYNKNEHDQAQADVERLLPFEDEGRALTEADKRIKEEEKRQERDQARYQRLLEQTAADRTRVAELEIETAGLAELNLKLNQASAALDATQFRHRLAQDRVASTRQQLDHIAYQAKERAKKEEQLQQVREALAIYKELQVAFGKKGVQALLIESAIPEIEDEANRLLTRMTDGRMNIRFETQREAKSGDSTIETLDIRIADEIGTRDYEMYSGGEAFRINFAIRVAISKILARRAGARLQTLVLDEGFGTQDVQGRERLVEAINAIQDDFEKIIVITHIDELKDAFPARIDVWKTSQGSQLAIR
ncbi:MAG: SMC family ATPase [Anaerolineales bacterium]|nr:SMC family ATPase [Anaerolineales bacterium]